MPVSPILSGRVPGSLLASELQRNVSAAQAELLRLGDIAATGQKFFRPGESPAAAVRTIFLQREIERNTQYVTNTQTDTSFLSAAENAQQSVADVLNQARAVLVSGTGSTATTAEKQALATDVQQAIRGLIRTANSTFRGRNLFGGTLTQGEPFAELGNGQVLYRGDAGSIDSHLERDFLVGNNVDGQTAFNALTAPISADLNPVLTAQTRLADLHGGAGVPAGAVRITIADGVNPPVTATVDLAGAETIGDVRTRLEAAFAAGPSPLAVGFTADGSGLTLTPSTGSVTVVDVNGGVTASRLGLTAGPAASISGGDLNPSLALATRLDDLQVGPLPGGTFRISSGDRTAVVDLSAATTVEDAIHAIRTQAGAQGVQVTVGLNDNRTGIAVSGRVSGADFSIGEDGGNVASLLGIRTFSAATRLADLDGGLGIPAGGSLEITRRSGQSVTVDLTGAATVQDVLDRINAVEPGVLTASVAAVGNGITLSDSGGTGPLSVADTATASALKLSGTVVDPNAALVGGDPNPQRSTGLLGLMLGLERALRSGDDRELARLGPQFDREIGRFSQVRADVSSRLKLLDSTQNRLLDRDVTLRQSLSDSFDADLTEVITQVNYRQQTLEATLRVSAQTVQLTLLNYL